MENVIVEKTETVTEEIVQAPTVVDTVVVKETKTLAPAPKVVIVQESPVVTRTTQTVVTDAA
jgi:hypothetical protein